MLRVCAAIVVESQWKMNRFNRADVHDGLREQQ